MMREIETILASNLGAGQFDYGFADLRGLLAPTYTDFNYGISILKRLDDSIVDGISHGPTIPYYEHYEEVNTRLGLAVDALTSFLLESGIEAQGIQPTITASAISERFLTTLRLGFSHKMLVTRSGLGWIGKTGLVITKKHGPRIRLASVLVTEKVMPVGVPINKSRCGKCSLCVDACPVGAANGSLWDVNTDRDEFLDAFACWKNCLEITKIRTDKDEALCGICIAACPIGLSQQGSKSTLNPLC